MIKIMIAEDQQLIRESLKIILNSIEGLRVISIVANGEEVLQQLENEKPDVMDGVESTRVLKQRYPDVHVLMLTTFNDDEYVLKALAYGASGYILKGISLRELKYSIETTVE